MHIKSGTPARQSSSVSQPPVSITVVNAQVVDAFLAAAAPTNSTGFSPKFSDSSTFLTPHAVGEENTRPDTQTTVKTRTVSESDRESVVGLNTAGCVGKYGGRRPNGWDRRSSKKFDDAFKEEDFVKHGDECKESQTTDNVNHSSNSEKDSSRKQSLDIDEKCPVSVRKEEGDNSETDATNSVAKNLRTPQKGKKEAKPTVTKSPIRKATRKRKMDDVDQSIDENSKSGQVDATASGRRKRADNQKQSTDVAPQTEQADDKCHTTAPEVDKAKEQTVSAAVSSDKRPERDVYQFSEEKAKPAKRPRMTRSRASLSQSEEAVAERESNQVEKPSGTTTAPRATRHSRSRRDSSAGKDKKPKDGSQSTRSRRQRSTKSLSPEYPETSQKTAETFVPERPRTRSQSGSPQKGISAVSLKGRIASASPRRKLNLDSPVFGMETSQGVETRSSRRRSESESPRKPLPVRRRANSRQDVSFEQDESTQQKCVFQPRRPLRRSNVVSTPHHVHLDPGLFRSPGIFDSRTKQRDRYFCDAANCEFSCYERTTYFDHVNTCHKQVAAEMTQDNGTNEGENFSDTQTKNTDASGRTRKRGVKTRLWQKERHIDNSTESDDVDAAEESNRKSRQPRIKRLGPRIPQRKSRRILENRDRQHKQVKIGKDVSESGRKIAGNGSVVIRPDELEELSTCSEEQDVETDEDMETCEAGNEEEERNESQYETTEEGDTENVPEASPVKNEESQCVPSQSPTSAKSKEPQWVPSSPAASVKSNCNIDSRGGFSVKSSQMESESSQERHDPNSENDESHYVTRDHHVYSFNSEESPSPILKSARSNTREQFHGHQATPLSSRPSRGRQWSVRQSRTSDSGALSGEADDTAEDSRSKIPSPSDHDNSTENEKEASKDEDDTQYATPSPKRTPRTILDYFEPSGRKGSKSKARVSSNERDVSPTLQHVDDTLGEAEPQPSTSQDRNLCNKKHVTPKKSRKDVKTKGPSEEQIDDHNASDSDSIDQSEISPRKRSQLQSTKLHEEANQESANDNTKDTANGSRVQFHVGKGKMFFTVQRKDTPIAKKAASRKLFTSTPSLPPSATEKKDASQNKSNPGPSSRKKSVKNASLRKSSSPSPGTRNRKGSIMAKEELIDGKRVSFSRGF